MKKKIHILDCGFGNIESVKNALDYLEINNEIINHLDSKKNISHLILPGVGNFKQCMIKLKKKELIYSISNYVQKEKKLLGICVGMQLMFDNGDEGGGYEGIKLFKGSCKKLETSQNFPLPQIGFNNVKKPSSPMWNDINENSNFYFVHEYGIPINYIKENPSSKFGVTSYKNYFISYIENKNCNVIGAQFHPEKSQLSGLKFLKNFSKL